MDTSQKSWLALTFGASALIPAICYYSAGDLGLLIGLVISVVIQVVLLRLYMKKYAAKSISGTVTGILVFLIVGVAIGGVSLGCAMYYTHQSVASLALGLVFGCASALLSEALAVKIADNLPNKSS